MQRIQSNRHRAKGSKNSGRQTIVFVVSPWNSNNLLRPTLVVFYRPGRLIWVSGSFRPRVISLKSIGTTWLFTSIRIFIIPNPFKRLRAVNRRSVTVFFDETAVSGKFDRNKIKWNLFSNEHACVCGYARNRLRLRDCREIRYPAVTIINTYGVGLNRITF